MPDPQPSNPNAREFVYLDRDQEGSHALREVLSTLGCVTPCHDLATFVTLMHEKKLGTTIGLLDTTTLMDSPTGLIGQLVEMRTHFPMGLVTDQDLEHYISHMRVWGLTQCLTKTSPVGQSDVEHFISMIVNPANGFGLISYLSSTIQMYSVALDTIASKMMAIERVINHFATCGFEVHELYDVRLILEEITNNCFFHAFLTASGEEKYSIANFTKLEPEENVRIEYGSDSALVGFSVTDNAGTLPVGVVISKLERQFNQEGVFDESGRGLYMSQMLAAKLVINIDRFKRTQIVALFEESRKRNVGRPKPFLVNYVGDDTFDEWRSDPDLD